MTKLEKSHFAQFRCGILPLRVETGRYSGLKVHERVCHICNTTETEDEIHFLFMREYVIFVIQQEQKMRFIFFSTETEDEIHFLFMREYVIFVIQQKQKMKFIFFSNVHAIKTSDKRSFLKQLKLSQIS